MVAVMYFVGFELDLVEVGGDVAAQAVVLVEQTPAKAGAVAAGVSRHMVVPDECRYVSGQGGWPGCDGRF